MIIVYFTGSSISISVDKSNENVRSIDLTNVELEFPDDETIQAFGLLGKVQCKLCKEAMGPVVKELDKHSSKVLFIIQISSFKFNFMKFT